MPDTGGGERDVHGTGPAGLPDPEEMAQDLHSADPDRVAAALEVLDGAWRRRPVLPMPMPDADALAAAFPAGAPEHVVDRFIRVVENYPLFEPPPDPGGRHTEALDAARLAGPGQCAYNVALAVRADENAEDAVQELMRHLLRRPLENDTEFAVVDQILDHLLDGRGTHAAVVDGLARWASLGEYDTLVQALSGRLDDAERARLEAARGS